MTSAESFIEVDYCQRAKHGQLISGDVFLSEKVKQEGRIVSVLSDGLGSGVPGPGGYAVACEAWQQSQSAPVVTADGLQADYDGDCSQGTTDLLGFLSEYFNPGEECYAGCS